MSDDAPTQADPGAATTVRRFATLPTRPPRYVGTSVGLLVDPDVAAADLHAGVITIEPGARVPLHWHEVGELQYVLSGTGWLSQPGGSSLPIEPGSAVFSPRGMAAAHGFMNTGPSDLVILFVYRSDDGSGPDIIELLDPTATIVRSATRPPHSGPG